jgi:hypothetical protein
MQTKKEKSKDNLRDIVLSDDSNIILPEVSFPSSYTNTQPAKYGIKSNEHRIASDLELLEYQKRVSRSDTTLTSEELKTLLSETNERRRALAQSIEEQKQAFEQKRTAEMETRYAKEREEMRQLRLKNENETQREKRIREEEEVKVNRAKEIQTLENKRNREHEDVIVFFEQSSNRFNSKYGNATKKSEDTGIDRIISSRPFSTNRYAHRCVPCGYKEPESLRIGKIYKHIYENQDQHLQFTINEIDRYYNTQKAETIHKHAAEDNPTLRNQRLSKEIEGLQKLKGAHYL